MIRVDTFKADFIFYFITLPWSSKNLKLGPHSWPDRVGIFLHLKINIFHATFGRPDVQVP